MTQRGLRPAGQAGRQQGSGAHEGLWVLIRLRDFVDTVANTSPARLGLTAFGMVVLLFTGLLFTGLLSLPAASGQATPLHDAMFTAVSAVCVTGLTVVTTATHWSFFGELVILGDVFVGGLDTVPVIAAGATVVSLGGLLLLHISGEPLDRVLFETISAFATCGLSTSLSAEVAPAGKYVLTALMFAGRVGTVTLAAALAPRQRSQLYHYPEERPIIG